MPVKLSYINARGEEIILDDDENTFAHELVGRTGFEMPTIDTETVEYADGTQDIIVAKMKSRTVTCYFWVDLDDKVEFERHLRDVKAKMLQTGNRMGSWGQLRIRQRDGTYVYLNCIYKSGFEGLVRDSNVRLKFSLTFEATDPLFYYGHDTEYSIIADADVKYLMMLPVDDPEPKPYVPPTNEAHDVYVDGTPVVRTQREVELEGEPYVIYHDAPTIGGDPLVLDIDNINNNPNGIYMLPIEDTEDDDMEHNPNSLYMETANMITSHSIELDCQKVYPTIKITGTGKNIGLYNKLTGRKIDISSTANVDGKSVVIDGKHYLLIETKPLHRKAVLVTEATGEEVSVLSALSADSTLEWFLERGENEIQYKNSDVSPASACTFIYREGFLSAE